MNNKILFGILLILFALTGFAMYSLYYVSEEQGDFRGRVEILEKQKQEIEQKFKNVGNALYEFKVSLDSIDARIGGAIDKLEDLDTRLRTSESDKQSIITQLQEIRDQIRKTSEPTNATEIQPTPDSADQSAAPDDQSVELGKVVVNKN